MKENRKPVKAYRIQEDWKMKENHSGRGKAFGAFVLGAAAGSAVALLFAPASGRITRRRIAMKFKAVGRSTSRQLQLARKVLVRKATYLRSAAAEKLGDTRQWLAQQVSNNGRRPLPRRAVHHA